MAFVPSRERVLLVDSDITSQSARAKVLRGRAVDVHTANNLMEAEVLWAPGFFSLVLLGLDEEAKAVQQFCRSIRQQSPKQKIAFLVGPPQWLKEYQGSMAL